MTTIAISPAPVRGRDGFWAGCRVAARRRLVVVAPGVADAELLLGGLVPETRGVRLAGGGWIATLAELVLDVRPTELHLVAHGQPGTLLLGGEVLSLATLGRHRPALAEIGAALGAGATLHLWACAVGAGDAGRRFVAALAEATGLTVAAASAAIGRRDGAACWDLDCLAGDGPVTVPFGAATRAGYPHALVFATASTYGTGVRPGDLQVGLAAGSQALAVANLGSNYVSLLLANGSGSFQPQTTFNVGLAQYAINFAPIATSPYTGLIVGENHSLTGLTVNSSGVISQQFQVTTNAYPLDGIAGTFNSNSGNFEVAVPDADTNNHRTSLVLVTGVQGGTVNAVQSINLGFTPGAVAFGDFNGDGIPDIAVTDQTNNAVDILIGGTGNTFSAPVSYAVGSSPTALAVGELDGDSYPDLVVANVDSDSVTVWRGTSNGSFTAPATYTLPAGSTPDAVAIADVNGDGKPDIIANAVGIAAVSVLYNAGSGTFYPVSRQFAVSSSQLQFGLGVGDFNGDGKPDVALVDQTNNDAEVLLNTTSHTVVVPSTGALIIGTSGPDTFTGSAATLLGTDTIIGGTNGANVLSLTGSGTYMLSALGVGQLKNIQQVNVSTGALSIADYQFSGTGAVSQIVGTGIESVIVTGGASVFDATGLSFTSIGSLSFAETTALLSTTAASSALPTTVIAGGGSSGVLVVGSNMIRSGVAYTLGTSGSRGELDVSGAASSTLDFSQLFALNNTKIIRNTQATGSSTSVTLPSFVNVTYVGGANSETVSAANAAVTVFGGSGNEKIVGGSGSGQVLIGGAGTDTLLGGSSATTIFGSDNSAFSSAGVKSITGAAGGTVLIGRQNGSATGVDTITATVGAETLFGGTANAMLVNNEPTSSAGACVLVGGSGNNTILGGNAAGNADTLFGGAGTGTNYITAGVGASQTLVGGAGVNVLRASQNADDVLFAGSGTNTFAIRSRYLGGTVTIVNFVHGRDTIDLSNVDSTGIIEVTSFSSSMVAASVTTFGNGYNIALPGASTGIQNIRVITGAGFNSSDFIF